MADQMKFSVSEAKSAKTAIERKATEIQKLMDGVKSDMQSVGPAWKGDAVKAFIDQYDKIKGDVTKLIESINTIGAQLEKQAQLQEQEDKDIASKLNASH